MNTNKHPWASTLVFLFGQNIITTLGAIMSTVSFLALLVVAVLSLSIEAPYIGILLFVILPGMAVLGLLLIPVGLLTDRIMGRNKGKGKLNEFVAEANTPIVRRTLIVVFTLTAINIIDVSAITYESVEYMSSVEFCGEACHVPMEPEFIAYKHSQHHAKIACIECHVGPGAEWFLKSKIAGIERLIGVITGEYDRPVQPPSYEMRLALETCGNCHNQDRNVGDKMVLTTRYGEDEANTPNYTALYMHVGGAKEGDNSIHGFHLSHGRKIYYVPPETDEDSVQYARIVEKDGAIHHYGPAAETAEFESIPVENLHRMDCTSCHNRPAHTFEQPGAALDNAITDGLIARDLPYIKMTALEALLQAAETGNSADISAHINNYYAVNYPDLNGEQRASLNQAIEESQAIFERNIFPKMNVTWGTYKNHLGHVDTPGCFRCHDDEHQTAEGRVISQDCTICHEVIAWNEEENDFITLLGLGQE